MYRSARNAILVKRRAWALLGMGPLDFDSRAACPIWIHQHWGGTAKTFANNCAAGHSLRNLA